MPIYTDDPGQGINQPINNVESGLGESLLSSLKQGFEEGPVISGIRFAQADMLANDPNSAIVSKPDADARLKEYGVKSINVPESGVTQAFLDHVIDERKESLVRQQIAMSAPSGWIATPLNFTASLAGSMADPGNAALAFVPFAGEAKAASVAGRFAERFVAGAKMGAVQAVATVPLTAQAAAAEGDDFTYGNALESTFFNTMAGGLMHAGGGLISDVVRARRPAATPERSIQPEAGSADIAQPVPVVTPDNIPSGIDIPDSGTNADLATAISRDAESYSYSRAYNDVVPDYLARQQELQSGFIDNVGDLLSELASNNHGLSILDDSLQQRISEYQEHKMKFSDVRAKALKDIQAEKDAFTVRNDEINQTLERNAVAEQARTKELELSIGKIPEELKSIIDERAQQIKESIKMSPVASAVRTAASAVREADWNINQQAYRASLAHMMDGRSPDVQPFYDLHKPALRERAVSRIQNSEPVPDEGGRVISEKANRVWLDTQKPDHEMNNAAADLENEFNLSDALLNDIATDNPDLAATMRENIDTIRAEANDESFGKALRAFAACMINRGL